LKKSSKLEELKFDDEKSPIKKEREKKEIIPEKTKE